MRNSKYQTPKSKQGPITEFPNSKTKTRGLHEFWSLVLGTSDINWNLVFVSWNLYPRYQRRNSRFQTPNSKKEPINEFPNSKLDRSNSFGCWSLVLGTLDINWYLVFDYWNLLFKGYILDRIQGKLGQKIGMMGRFIGKYGQGHRNFLDFIGKYGEWDGIFLEFIGKLGQIIGMMDRFQCLESKSGGKDGDRNRCMAGLIK